MSRDPRYQQESFVPWVNLGETPAPVPLPVWNLDGISWSDAPTPPRRHEHWPQTVGRADHEEFKRCPCGATWSRQDGWHCWPTSQERPEEPIDWQGIAIGVAAAAFCFLATYAEMGWPG